MNPLLLVVICININKISVSKINIQTFDNDSFTKHLLTPKMLNSQYLRCPEYKTLKNPLQRLAINATLLNREVLERKSVNKLVII